MRANQSFRFNFHLPIKEPKCVTEESGQDEKARRPPEQEQARNFYFVHVGSKICFNESMGMSNRRPTRTPRSFP